MLDEVKTEVERVKENAYSSRRGSPIVVIYVAQNAADMLMRELVLAGQDTEFKNGLLTVCGCPYHIVDQNHGHPHPSFRVVEFN